MHISILALGSRGDVQPYANLRAWEQQRAEGLVLCQSRYVFLYYQVGDKLADFLLTHLHRMVLVVMENEAPDQYT